ncbi:MAG: hypothetical protein EBV32_03180 [Proteobacteria bacterium]|uniref:AsmA family protein n=1 Tax=Candidatus Fonsibacter lacus TaxID=2576439 RepID=A0A964V2V6_9PROT|nr:hypothetical protein [Candidatus Fonsibacter lacus]NBP59940.1 hypothetical protein [Pseudomonadota bacterium]NCU72144.1 hypothetical protein [Candidatus Fonsibacter lacus]
MVAFAVIFLIIFFLPFFINLDQYKSEIENQIQEKFFIKTKINEKISYKPFLRPHIELFSVDIFETNKKEDIYIGNIYKINLRINIFNLILRNFNITDVEVVDGIIELENNYFDNFFKNADSIKNLKAIKINNLDLKYSSNKSSIEISDINSDITFDKGNLRRFDLTGNLFNLPFESTFQGSRNKDKSIGRLSIKSNDLKFYFDADLTDINFLKNEFLGNAKIRFANTLSTIGLNNLTLQFNFDLKDEHVDLKNILVNSFLYKGEGSAKIDFKPRLAFFSEFNFIDTNFKKLSNSNLKDYLVHNKLFNIHEDFYGVFKLNFKNMVTNHNLFSDANAIIIVEGGDVNIKELNLISKFNDLLKINGRFITQNRETIFFFNSQIDLVNIKNFYKNTNGAREKIALLPNASFSGKMKGDLNMKKGRVVVNEIIGNSNKKFNKNNLNIVQEEFNLRLNKDILNVLDPRIYSFLF